MRFVYQSSIIYLILGLIYWMVTIFIFVANHQYLSSLSFLLLVRSCHFCKSWHIPVTNLQGTFRVQQWRSRPGVSCWIWLPCVTESLLRGTVTVTHWSSEFSLLLVFVIIVFLFFAGEGYQPSAQSPTWTRGSLFVLFLPFALFGMGGPTRST